MKTNFQNLLSKNKSVQTHSSRLYLRNNIPQKHPVLLKRFCYDEVFELRLFNTNGYLDWQRLFTIANNLCDINYV